MKEKAVEATAKYEKFAASARGYHTKKIERGVFGETSKIREEYEEFVDATEQGVSVMQLVELADLFGAIEGWLQKYHPNVTLEQLVRMKDLTKRAFEDGTRKARS